MATLSEEAGANSKLWFPDASFPLQVFPRSPPATTFSRPFGAFLFRFQSFRLKLVKSFIQVDEKNSCLWFSYLPITMTGMSHFVNECLGRMKVSFASSQNATALV